MALWINRREQLQDLDVFSGVSAKEAAQIRSLFTMLTAPAGTVLTQEGSYGQEFMVLAGGEASVSITTPDGPKVVATLTAGDFFGEMSLLDGDPRSATVIATTPITFYVCNTAEFAGLLEIAPRVAARIAAAALQRQVANTADLRAAA